MFLSADSDRLRAVICCHLLLLADFGSVTPTSPHHPPPFPTVIPHHPTSSFIILLLHTLYNIMRFYPTFRQKSTQPMSIYYSILHLQSYHTLPTHPMVRFSRLQASYHRLAQHKTTISCKESQCAMRKRWHNLRYMR